VTACVRNSRGSGLALSLMVALCACRGDPTGSAPALLVDPDAATRVQLQRVVAAALHDADVTLSEDALVRDSILIIERQRHLAPGGTRIDGRELERPLQFQLIREGRDCILVQVGTDRRWSLPGVECATVRNE